MLPALCPYLDKICFFVATPAGTGSRGAVEGTWGVYVSVTKGPEKGLNFNIPTAA
jgi:hypothetical protein